MSSPITKFKAAAVTSEPGWFDLELSVQKTIHWINEAAKAGCRLVAFPEVWIPGHPFWIFQLNYQQSLPLLKAYRETSLKANSGEMLRIRRAARDNKIYVSLGFSELDLATLYMTQVLISPTGDVINFRRKIKPTHAEKLIFGDATNDTFTSVTSTELGGLGQLNCWENMNPFLKALNASQGEQVHVAAWPLMPGQAARVDPAPASLTAEVAADVVNRAYAIETGAYVIAPMHRVTRKGIEASEVLARGVDLEQDFAVNNGFARIYSPDGRVLAKPDPEFDGLLVVDIDTDETHLTKAIADFGGHYARPDLLRLLVDTGRKELVTEVRRDGGLKAYSTLERVGLDRPLEDGEREGEEERN
ncbi:uncharacterized protein K452DRAFT_322835 [Aplosporella prunicola CBS 121167]|uniref:CN hydrolase domain-containing protein n=1 Tax=Aplosporella prunicola CBS 121167 TaxID=1176127 RepID=A0A6A6AXA3_9PEZI|nr:uncharacterized protein K452DRAFT_322835 [Aplosporella prunicola CBS 121167]KAF2135813.1 hypothetical protein K452DRAFT_322835 [Aplosporella prunicola CBS 121167]